MAEKSTVYIKISGSTIVEKKKVLLKDISVVQCSDKKIENEMKNIQVFSISENKKNKYVLSSMKVVEEMLKRNSSVDVVNMGENDFIIEYMPNREKGKIFEWVKVCAVSLTVFFGAAFTIMTFNEDVSAEKIFKIYGSIVCDNLPEDDKTIQIAYSIGLPVGILIFFNHISKAKFTSDPTPLQVQLRTYEKDTNSAIIDNASREGKEEDANS